MRADVLADADWVLSTQLADGGLAHFPDKVHVNPYFANLAALGLARATEMSGNPVYAEAVWDWLDWYAAHMDASGFVTDYNVAPVTQALTSTGSMDSTDSYAGTFLHAAHKVWKVTGNGARLAALSAGLAGAVTAIEATQEPDGLTWAKPTYKVKYLMDQSEAWAGLQAAYVLAGVIGDTALRTRALAGARAMAAGVATLWNAGTGTYDWARFENGTHAVVNWSVMYPDSTSQVWPVAFGLVRGPRAKGLVDKFDTLQPLWDQSGYEVVAGWAFAQAGKVAGYLPDGGWALPRTKSARRALTAAGRIRARAISTSRAWPHHTGIGGELIVLESADSSYLAPLTL
ncbi:MAG: glycoside hydrolase family 76 protein [Gemmatimonadota bacterium]|nr:glycoside hydrolase family 76 protein [Gemmatimonadota bacterium]